MSELSQARADARELSQEQQLSIARNARLVERTRIRELIQARIDTLDRTRDRANWNDPFREGKTAGFRAALSATAGVPNPDPAAPDENRVTVDRADLEAALGAAEFKMRAIGRWRSEQDACDRLRAALSDGRKK